MNIYLTGFSKKKIVFHKRYTNGALNCLTSARKECHHCCRLSGAIYNIGCWLKQEYSTLGPGIWESCKASLCTSMLEGLDVKICWQVFYWFLMMIMMMMIIMIVIMIIMIIIIIHKNATEVQAERQIGVSVSFKKGALSDVGRRYSC